MLEWVAGLGRLPTHAARTWGAVGHPCSHTACPTPQKFEAYALETCLHVPAGLLADQVRQQADLCRCEGSAFGKQAPSAIGRSGSAVCPASQSCDGLGGLPIPSLASRCLQAADGEGETAVDEAEEAAAEAELAQLRDAISAAKHQGGWAGRLWGRAAWSKLLPGAAVQHC